MHYHFLTEDHFKRDVAEGEMLEHAHVFGNFYGSPKGPVQTAIDGGEDVLFDIDWQGAEQLSKHKELNLLKIFILPPSIEELEKRLVSRNQDGKDAIKRRLSAYTKDVTHSKDYDYVIINDKVELCFKQIKHIILNHLKKKN